MKLATSTAIATRCRIDFVKELLERLNAEESKHVRWVEDMISRLNAGKDVV